MVKRKKATGEKPAPVRLWLIRHAHAVDAAQNTVRPVSKRGRKQIRALARFLDKTGALRPVEIWHSPLVRSRQSAELLAAALKLAAPLVQVTGLLPDDTARPMARRLKRVRDVAIFGHEPHLSALASLLVTGAAEPPAFVLKKCAVLALERVAAMRWVVRWQVSPEVIG